MKPSGLGGAAGKTFTVPAGPAPVTLLDASLGRGGSILPPAEPHHHPDKIHGDGSHPVHMLKGKS